MIWFYSRRDEKLQIETWYDDDAREYVMSLRQGDSTTTERFAEGTAFRARLVQLERELEAGQLSGAGSRVMGGAVRRTPKSRH